jgi:hypothetical protein
MKYIAMKTYGGMELSTRIHNMFVSLFTFIFFTAAPEGVNGRIQVLAVLPRGKELWVPTE